MKKQNYLKLVKNLLFSFVLFFSIFFFSFSTVKTAYAGSTLPDDGTFNPSLTTDYSLNFIELTEENDSVYVYIYQPANDDTVLATSINISINLFKLDFKNYKLQYVSKNSVTYVFNYLVKNLAVKDETKRVYEISSIYRPFIDGDIDYSGQTTTEKAFAVEKCFTFITNEDGTVSGSVLETETILITDKFVGFVRYMGGLPGINYSCDNHFVAFSTDKEIDKLREADVYFTSQNITNWTFSSDVYGDKKDEYSYLKYTDKEIIQSGLLWLNKFSWNTIQTVTEFKENISDSVYSSGSFDNTDEEEITETLNDTLENMTHVLRFATTKYLSGTAHNGLTTDSYENYTKIGDVAILRLKFETGGSLFEYAAVDDKTSGSKDPVITVGSGSSSGFIDDIIAFFKNAFIIIIIVIVVILFIAFSPVITPVLAVIVNGLVFLVKKIINILFWLITLPIKIFKRD